MYLVTGATGLLGNQIVRQLLAAGEQVRVLMRPSSDPRPLQGLTVETAHGDVHDLVALRQAAGGVTHIIHSAGHVHLGWSQEETHRLVNVEGTRCAIAAAVENGARLVHISSVNALGLGRLSQPADENSALPGVIPCPYVLTKQEAERLVVAAGAALSAVIVNPGFLLGPGDWKPSSGKMLLEVAKFAPLAPTGAFSVCDVRDVAAATLVAAKSPQATGRYILAGHNISYLETWRQFARAAGKRGPRFRAGPINRWIGALAGDAWGRITGREPNLNSAGMRMSCQEHCFSSARAQAELGYQIRPLEETIADAWQWFVEHDYV